MPLSPKSLKALQEAAQHNTLYTSDSRKSQAHSIFVALKGTQSDGHNFLGAALEKGASLCVCAMGHPTLNTVSKEGSKRILEVEDTHLAHRELARLFRNKFRGTVVGVGGSAGKTSTKDFLHTLLSQKFRTLKTQKSANGEEGIPKTLEELGPAWDCAVIEIGIDAPDSMKRHVDIVQPDLALLTSIGEEHLNLLGDIENVYLEEKVLFDETWARGGLCFAPTADTYLERMKGTPQLRFVEKRGDVEFPFDHEVLKQNASLAWAVAEHMGLSRAQLLKGLSLLEIPEGRGRISERKAGLWVIEDHYNSNPASLKASLEHAKQCAQEKHLHLVLILGDMLDLGTQSQAAHQSIVEAVTQAQAQQLYLIGPMMSALSQQLQKSAKVVSFESAEAAAASLKMGAFEKSVVLFKGSRGMHLEHILNTWI